jgi:hypothetical protein
LSLKLSWVRRGVAPPRLNLPDEREIEMEDVFKWACEASPGELKVYHSGPRAQERRRDACIPQEEAFAFSKAWQAHEHGLVFLARRRMWKGRHAGYFQYLAIRVSTKTAEILGLIPRTYDTLSYRRVW